MPAKGATFLAEIWGVWPSAFDLSIFSAPNSAIFGVVHPGAMLWDFELGGGGVGGVV